MEDHILPSSKKKQEAFLKTDPDYESDGNITKNPDVFNIKEETNTEVLDYMSEFDKSGMVQFQGIKGEPKMEYLECNCDLPDVKSVLVKGEAELMDNTNGDLDEVNKSTFQDVSTQFKSTEDDDRREKPTDVLMALKNDNFGLLIVILSYFYVNNS